jgi:hypothetical protein
MCYLLTQLSANVHALHPDKHPSTLNIMTGRSELALKYSIMAPDGTLVPQYMCYANVYCVIAEEARWKMEIVVYGKAVLGGAEDAMARLAEVVEVSGGR